MAFRGYLPYAVAFGLAEEWAGRFAQATPLSAAAQGTAGWQGMDGSLSAAFTGAACSHVHSVASHGGLGGAGDHGGYGGHYGGHGSHGSHGGHGGFGGF